MALTTPFINTLSAFDATKGTQTALNVKGGDAITSYEFFIYDNAGNLIYSSNKIAVRDFAGGSIRQFPIVIPANLSGLQNNSSYRLQGKTNNKNETAVSNYAVFSCYATPLINIFQNKFVGETSRWVDLTQDGNIQGSSIEIQIVAQNTNLNSPAVMNIGELTLYGIDNQGSKNYISTTDKIYDFTFDSTTNTYTAHTTLSGFAINADADYNTLPNASYVYYEVDYEFSTIENMIVFGAISNIKCYYKTLTNSPYLVLANLCQQGVIKVTSTLTSLKGTSNPSPPIYLDDEVDLTEDGSWVQWSKHFILNQPYTLRLWGRNFKQGKLLSLTYTNAPNKYINVYYNTTDKESYISLECGDDEFPYYIESDRLLLTDITNKTNLFVGIQQQGYLFDIDFEILE